MKRKIPKPVTEQTPIQKAQAAQMQMREDGIVLKKRNPLEILAANMNSYKAIVNATCYQCVGGNLEGEVDVGWRERITTCDITDCASHHKRPYQTNENEAENE